MSIIGKFWSLSGKTLYYTSLPALVIYFYFTQRTRVLVVVGDEILVEKAWMGSGRWILPGGGLHKGEDPESGAVRELSEESGINVDKSKLEKLFSGKVRSEHLATYFVHAYLLELKEKPELNKQKIEIGNLRWINWQKVYNDIPPHHDIARIIDRWRDKK